MIDSPVLLFLLGQLITGAAIWGAIRADLKNMHQRINEVKTSTDNAHERLNRFLEQRAGDRVS